MKRDKKEEFELPNSVRRTYPILIWRECEKCGKEFKYEWLWCETTLVPGIAGGGMSYIKSFVCKNCASTSEEARKILYR
jgi:hypothetical protein